MSREGRSRVLLLLGIPFGVLCGILGLSGTEYRAPVLRAFFRRSATHVAPFNLTISLLTLAGGIVGREPSTSAAHLWPLLPELAALVAGSILGLVVAARSSGRVTAASVERWTTPGLVVIGAVLVGVATLPRFAEPLPAGIAVRVPAGLALGSLIGAVSSVRSISGGELLVPALVLAFGVDIKLAGTASACISFPIVLASLVRHTRAQPFEREREYREMVVPMGAGSALGAVTGGYLVGRVESAVLMILFGSVLIASGVRSFQNRPED